MTSQLDTSAGVLCDFTQKVSDGPTMNALNNQKICDSVTQVTSTTWPPGYAAVKGASDNNCIYAASGCGAPNGENIAWGRIGALEMDVTLESGAAAASSCKNIWSSVWLDPRPYFRTSEVDLVETNNGQAVDDGVYTNFGGLGTNSIWAESLQHGFRRHVTAWAVPTTNGAADIIVRNCECPGNNCPKTCGIDTLPEGASFGGKNGLAITTINGPESLSQGHLLIADMWGKKTAGDPPGVTSLTEGCNLYVQNATAYTCGLPGLSTCKTGAACVPQVLGRNSHGEPALFKVEPSSSGGKCVAEWA